MGTDWKINIDRKLYSPQEMSDEEIDKAIRDAEQYAASDHVRREALEVRNEAGMEVNKVQMALNKVKKELPKEEKKQIKSELSNLEKMLSKSRADKMTEEDIRKMKEGMERLRDCSSAVHMAEMENGK